MLSEMWWLICVSRGPHNAEQNGQSINWRLSRLSQLIFLYCHIAVSYCTHLAAASELTEDSLAAEGQRFLKADQIE